MFQQAVKWLLKQARKHSRWRSWKKLKYWSWWELTINILWNSIIDPWQFCIACIRHLYQIPQKAEWNVKVGHVRFARQYKQTIGNLQELSMGWLHSSYVLWFLTVGLQWEITIFFVSSKISEYLLPYIIIDLTICKSNRPVVCLWISRKETKRLKLRTNRQELCSIFS